MKLKDKLKMRFLLSFGRFYFTAILLIILLLIALLIGGLLNSDRISNVGKLGKVFVFLFIAAATLIRGAFKALFFKLPKPQGVLMKKNKAPEIYNVIDEVRKATKCPKIHHILLNSEFNAFISEIPSIGMFGWYRRYLVIGLPLLLTLSEEELKAVIAHECGHLSRSHGKSSVKLYRAKAVWENIAKEFDKEGSKGSFLVDGFIKRYLPALNAVYFSTSRQHEYEADKKALAVVDKQTFANALMKVSLYSSILENKFWTSIGMLNKDFTSPVEDVFFRMENEAANPISEEVINTFVERIMNYNSLPCSTHPSYSERLKALKVDKPVISVHNTNALRKILKDTADSVLQSCSMDWSSRASDSWTRYYNDIVEIKNKLNELEQKSVKEQLSIDDSLERAFIIERLEGTEKAIDAFKAVKEVYPDNLSADYNLGRLLTYKGSDEGVEILRSVMERDYQAIPDCCFEIVNYYCYKDDQSTASQYYDYAVNFMETHDDVKSERSGLLLNERYLPHDLSETSVQKIREELLKYKEIKKAYLTIKYVKLSYQFPIYVVGVKFKSSTSKRRKEIRNRLASAGLMPWNCWIVQLNGKNRVMEYNMDQIPDSRIL